MKHINYDEEYRNDFFVDEKRKKIWDIELDLYLELKRVCDKYGIKYFAMGGTLLGTIRHKGFIPWDDDMDIALERDEYEKLCKVANKEFKEPYFFQTALTDRNYFFGYARFRRSDTTGVITHLTDYKYNNGIFIDIYIYDKISSNKKLLKKKTKKISNYFHLLNNYYHLNSRKFASKLLVPFLKLFKFFVSYEKLYDKYKNICMSFKNDKDCDKLGFMCNPMFMKYLATEKGVKNLIIKKFEGYDMPVPEDYEFMLKSAYGNYMEFPPVENRGKWHDNIIIFDPDISFLDYYRKHKDMYRKVLDEYDNK